MIRKVESEKTLEARLREEIKKRGGMAVKLTSQFQRGLPDRIVLMPGGRTYFVELKSTGKKPTALQLKQHAVLQRMEFPVFVVDSTTDLHDFLAFVDLDQEDRK